MQSISAAPGYSQHDSVPDSENSPAVLVLTDGRCNRQNPQKIAKVGQPADFQRNENRQLSEREKQLVLTKRIE